MAQQKSAAKPSSAQAGSAKSAAAKSAAAKQAAGNPKQAPGASGEGAAGGNLFGDDSNGRPKGPTEITATQEAQFDVKSRSGVFIGNVKVVDPQFTLTSDRLTVHLNKDEEGGGLNDAEAIGNVVIVHINQPKTPPAAPTTGATPGAKTAAATPARPQQPTTSIGKAEKALYEAKDGSVTLTGWPQITQGGNTHVATSPGVRMVLFRDGRMQTFGGTRTLIEDRSTATNNPNANGAQ